MEPCPPPDDLAALLIDEPAGRLSEAVRAHVRSCPTCQHRLDGLSDDPELRAWAQEFGEDPVTEGDGSLGRLLDALREAPRPTPGDVGRYEFLAAPRREGDLGWLDGYPVRAEIGRGGMGIVLLGFDDDLERPVALKVLRPDLADEPARDRFVREAQAAARVRHDHVVGVYGVANPPSGLPYCVLEYLAGPSLAGRLAAEGPLAPREAARVAVQVADGLSAAHGAGVIHRDIKPANILFDPANGRSKIADFGLAQVAASASGPAAPAGTPAYMSPEQARGVGDVGPAADVFGLGATLYEMLTGTPPFPGSARALPRPEGEEPAPVRLRNPSVPRDLETICLKCLRSEPAGRYASARELADDLRRFLAGEPIAARPISPVARGLRWARRRPALASLAAFSVLATAVLLVGGAAYGLRLRAANRRAEANFQTAFAAVNRLLTRVAGEGLSEVPETESLRRELLRDSQDLLRALLADPAHAGDPSIRRELARVHRHMGQLHDGLGDPAAAESEYRRALGLFGVPGRGDALDAALTRGDLGRLLARQYRRPEADRELDEARRLLEPLARDDPAARPALARIDLDRAGQLIAAGRPAEANAVLREAADRLGPAAGHADVLAPVLTRLASVEPGVARREALYFRALALWEGLARDRPDSRAYRDGLAGCLNDLGSLYAFDGEPDRAEPLLARAVSLREELSRTAPHAPMAGDNLALALTSLGAMYQNAGRRPEARAAYMRALALRESLIRGGLRVAHQRRLTVETCQNLALLHSQDNRADLALPLFDRALSEVGRLRADSPGETGLARLEAIILTNSSLLLTNMGQAREALIRLDRAVSLAESIAGPGPAAPSTRDAVRKAYGARAGAREVVGSFGEAASDWGRVAALSDPAGARVAIVSRGLALARAGRHRAAADEATRAAESGPPAGPIFYNCACIFSLASATAKADSSLRADAAGRLSDRCADRAERLLRRAYSAGFFVGSVARDLLDGDVDLAPLRPRPEFPALRADLTFPADPFARRAPR